MTNTTVCLDNLPPLPHDKEGPVFKEPWEAQAFALAVRLSEGGYFTWSEWVEVFSREIKSAQGRGDPDLGDTYYHHWLNALERICAEKGLVGNVDMDRRRDEWRRAYLNTPHGKPIELAAAFRG
jgi:nitrile hydratase accessory protein